VASRGAIAGEPGEGDVRAHEGARPPRRLLALGVDQARLADEDPPPPARPPPLDDRFAAAQRPGEEQVEGGGQQEAVGSQAVAGIESGVVEHLEIERSVSRSGGVEEILPHLEADPGQPLLDLDPRLEQPVDRRRPIERFEGAVMRLGAGRFRRH
jgi:hypothetical protein